MSTRHKGDSGQDKDAEGKLVRINLRVEPKLRDDFHTVAFLRKSTMSELLHNFIVKTVHEEKQRAAAVFELRENSTASDKPEAVHMPPEEFEALKKELQKGDNGETKTARGAAGRKSGAGKK